ncbi:hypothetical protein PHYSODRAFT_487528 [Phytophthora sojae]|uniref:Uncharacterized protein n=1 Tax=Phytophthora sojae (strain P6497) TaxID=1094619 RepID=G4YW06_PHYSP|nr:hypothetical protein PHYSODRAFT_487528 [Phytophthora sojae]EGZ24389.1 hypothetical protein PHYSODRAFT_487528 [Phytophthora sojae]|eukprot:XP_009519677.1 hypothetical protein PHYSODRAFT_487528 [Phytophthora sojae]
MALTAARAACLRVDALPHVLLLVSQYLDASAQWSLPRAAQRGFVHLVRRLLARTPRSLATLAEIRLAMRHAAANNHLNILQLLCKYYNNAVIDEAAVMEASANGHVQVLQWLQRQLESLLPGYADYDFYSVKSVAAAAENGHLEAVKWLLQARGAVKCMKETHLHQAAARGGHLEVVRWLRTHLMEQVESRALDEAAANGFVEVVEFLHQEWTAAKLESNRGSCSATARAMNGAASNGHLGMVKWLDEDRDDGCTGDAMNRAAWNGHLEVVKWLHEHRTEGCTQQAMNMAAKGGHLEIVQFLHEQRREGCTYNAMDWAAHENHLEIVQWLHANRTEGCSRLTMNEVAKRGHLEMIKWLHANRTEGCTVAALNAAATYGHLDIVKFLHQNRSEGCTTAAMDGAAENNHLAIVQWLHLHRSEGCTTRAMDMAARDFPMLKWLHSIYSDDAEEWPIHAGLAAITNDRVEVLHWVLKTFRGSAQLDLRLLYNAAHYHNRAHMLAYLDGKWAIEFS